MQYYQIVIFFHRPWVSKSYIQPQNPKQGPGHQHARRTCAESATAIARLLRLYEKYYTFRRINNQVVAIIFTAALMLIFVTISMSPQDTTRLHPDDQRKQAEMAAHLNVCFRALDELGQSFENAKRTRDFLVSLQRRWQNHMRHKSSSKSKRSLGSSTGQNMQDGIADGPSTRRAPLSSVSPPIANAAVEGSRHLPNPHGPKKPRLAEQSILDDAGLGVNFVDSLLPTDIEFGSLGNNGLNWTPSSRDLKMLSEELGNAPLFSTASPGSAMSSLSSPARVSDQTTMLPRAAPGEQDDGASAWWKQLAHGVNGLHENHHSR